MKYKLGQICEIVSGSTPKTSVEEYWDGNVKWITPAELSDNSYIIEDSVRKITELGVQKTGLTPFPKGTVILSSRAPIGKVAIAGCEMYCNQGFKNLICSEKVNNKYLFWFLKGKTEFLNALGRGATFKEISKSIVSDIEINVPNIEEQEKAVSVLEKIFQIINLRRKELSEFEKLIKARFVEMFGDMVINPNNWDKHSLGELCDVRDGTHDSPQYYGDGYPLVTSKNVTDGKIDITNCNFISEEDYKKINQRSKVDIGDILMPMIGTVGNPVIVDIEPNFAIKNVALIKFKSDSRVLNSFVKILLESDYFDNAVISKIRGGTQKFISLGDIRKLDICLPPLEVQISFEKFIKQVDKSKVVVPSKIKNAIFAIMLSVSFGQITSI